MASKEWDHHAVVFGWRTTQQFPSATAATDSLVSDAQLVAILAALGNGLRLNLWRMLLPFGSNGLSAGIIAARMCVVPSSLSFHLRQMTHAGVLVQRRTSRQIIYAVNQEIIDAVLELLATLITTCGGSAIEAGDLVSEGCNEGEGLGS